MPQRSRNPPNRLIVNEHHPRRKRRVILVNASINRLTAPTRDTPPMKPKHAPASGDSGGTGTRYPLITTLQRTRALKNPMGSRKKHRQRHRPNAPGGIPGSLLPAHPNNIPTARSSRTVEGGVLMNHRSQSAQLLAYALEKTPSATRLSSPCTRVLNPILHHSSPPPAGLDRLWPAIASDFTGTAAAASTRGAALAANHVDGLIARANPSGEYNEH